MLKKPALLPGFGSSYDFDFGYIEQESPMLVQIQQVKVLLY